MSETKRNSVTDLGIAAYLLMMGFKVSSRMGREVLFDIGVDEEAAFNKAKVEYLNSDFHRFDSYLMVLKKM